ncbi:related to f-box/wd-repeat protein pof10 [Cephalotrichum gorgonifer]|uniref:Related to f-box/wd-repeat protein pof10 n=1 Tax=Cephalotrichum gorgonifer TaxID=2041049 RepID=A0AAE8SYM1_9PEZI|nr:related to f-box/wd-repeat protein pof10 [Cephalotrichum gorgonifer]
MQQVFSNSLTQIVSEPQTPRPLSTTSSQYGFQPDHASGSGSQLRSPSPRTPSVASDVTSGFGSDSWADGIDFERFNERLRGLNLSDRHPGLQSPGKRVSDHENASSHVARTPRRRVEFRVIPRVGDAAPDSPSITDFPNEVLTTIMSYLHPESYAAMSLVCKQFNALVKSPYAWKAAFHRMYSTRSLSNDDEVDDIWADDGNIVNPTHSRYFNRLTSKATWQSEYVLRSQLLRGLAQGRPLSRAVNSAGKATKRAHAVITYDSRIPCVITNLYAEFPGDKLPPRAMHGGADIGLASLSNPATGKMDIWARDDIYTLGQVEDIAPHLELYGVAEGPAAGPNVMDLSTTYGFIAGEGFPGGHPYFRPVVGKRGRVVDYGNPLPETYTDIPRPPPDVEGMSSVWIAKTNAIPLLTGGMIGILTGSTLGIVTAYALGRHIGGRRRFEDGEMSCRWVLSPGVPVVSIRVDEKYSAHRKAADRIWAVALNALGEMFYLKDTPKPVGQQAPGPEMVRNAYLSGRTVHWHLVEPTRRMSKSQSGEDLLPPRSSTNAMGLDSDGWLEEARSISAWLLHRPTYFRSRYRGWDMRRRLEVDFAADDGNGAGEALFLFDSGHAEELPARVQRFARLTPQSPVGSSAASTTIPSPEADTWHVTQVELGDVHSLKITTSALDSSTCALTTLSEDPLAMADVGPVPSPSAAYETSTSLDIPGGRSRFIAVGTDKGSMIIWNARDPHSSTIPPIKVIHTDSPEVSCIGLTALYAVHGGSDGLVQAWDTLALTKAPIRTINTRSGNRIPRHLAQINPGLRAQQFSAATAICMDPDATKLRGVVSFGAFIRSWSYCSGGQPPAAKRKGGLDKETVLESSDLMELQERNSQLREKFGSGDLNLTEEEALVYALMVSEESLAQDEVRRLEAVEALLLTNDVIEEHSSSSGEGSEGTTGFDIAALASEVSGSSDSFAADFYHGGDPFVEAIGREPSGASSPGDFEFPITYKKKGKKSKKGGANRAAGAASSSS